MLPSFGRPVWWGLGCLPNRDEFIPLLELEAAEFTAVLGQPVRIHGDGSSRDSDVWDVVVDPAVGRARLEAELASRRLSADVARPVGLRPTA